MIQESSASALQSGLRSYDQSAAMRSGSSNRAKTSFQQQSNQSGQSSPDVVATFTAAGLEASRSVSQPAEITEQERTEERVGELEAQESPAKQQMEMNRQSEQQQSGRIDLMA